MESLKKPMSEKILRRRAKREAEKLKSLHRKLKSEEKNAPSTSKYHHSHLQKPKPPPGLKGRALGLWYRDRYRMMDKEGGEKQEKEKKEKDDESARKHYRIFLSSELEKRIKQYLSSVESEPPPSLAAQLRMIKSNNLSSLEREQVFLNEPCASGMCNTKSTSAEPSGIEHLGPTSSLCVLEKMEAPSQKVKEESAEPANTATTSKGANEEAINYWVYGGAVDRTPKKSNVASLKQRRMKICPSVEKYKYLEDTSFKKKFLKNLTGTIESNLEEALGNVKLDPNEKLDKELKMDLEKKEKMRGYSEMLATRKNLPAYNMSHDILELIRNNQVVLISGETGCGKTTQVGQFILDDAIKSGVGSTCSVICTQPRRISAVSVAHRVAQERCEYVGGGSVGYQIRLERKVCREKGAILFCTTGILIQFMQSDPALSRYSHIILDEIHERDTVSDFVLTIIKDVILKRKDLKVILMSATLNANQFSQYFNDCPLINIPGYTYPVREFYLEDVLASTRFMFPPPDKKAKKKAEENANEDFEKNILPYVRELRTKRAYPEHVLMALSDPKSEQLNPDLVIELLRHICTTQGPGAVLIFVPGWEDISNIHKRISTYEQTFPTHKYMIIPLHSMMPTVNQQSVFDRPPPGVRKIVIATNIAETSITIDDVVFVIDCGKIKIRNFDVVRNLSTLKPEWVSKANAKQRRGRAGRVQPGICYHLFSRARERLLLDYTLPEMLRTRLEEVVLNVKILQLGRVQSFLSKVLDPPNPLALSLALDLLLKLNALDENENLTPLGYHLAQLPLDPQIGKMLLMASIMSCLNPVLSIAATLNFRDPFYVPLGNEKEVNEKKLQLDKGNRSDHMIMAEVMRRWEECERVGRGRDFCYEHFLTRSTLFSLKELKSQFARYLYDMGFLKTQDYTSKNVNQNSNNVALVKAVICSGLYPNVAVIRRKFKVANGTKTFCILYTAEDGKVSLHPKSVNSCQPEIDGSFLVYHEKLKSTNVFLHDTSIVPAIPMLLFGHNFSLTDQKKKGVIITLKKDLNFSCPRRIADLITELRFRLDWLLEYKLSHPGEISWEGNTAEVGLLKALVELISCEHNQLAASVESEVEADSSSESSSTD